ncbi:NADH:flavin oxidoreductase [Candidatus Bathyarchaeota archaeon]|nr:NADH:flavin oxidoreductase [Candidatus Bathyarchaeota archaeon]
MSTLFEPYQIRDLLVRNRFMRSATTSAYADEDGIINNTIIKHYERMSKGETGLIVKGHLYVLDKGKAHPGMAGISHDKHIPMLKKLTETVHKHGGHIVAQLNHAGVVHQPDRAGPSKYNEADWTARKMTEDEIQSIIRGFGDAAERALQAEFDGVQIHGAHGYLISQFLSRRVNKREDKWGGSLEKRMRLLHEVYNEVRGRLGNNPVLIKMNSDDFSPEGFTVEDAVKVAKTLSEKGIDLIEVSGGGRGSKEELRERAKHSDYPELDFAGHGFKIREAIKPTPMALVSGFKTLETMKKAVADGLTDMVSMSRPFIREPALVKSLKKGQKETTCIRCDACRANFGKAMMQCLLE